MAAFGCCAVSGCMLFTSENAVARSANGNPLPPIQAPADAIQLDVMFVERPINDPLLGRALWEEMDQMIDIPAERRMNLHENGFRLGLAGTEAPPTLAALLEAGEADEFDQLEGFWQNHRYALRRGQKTEVDCSHHSADWSIVVARDGVTESKSFSSARGVLHLELAAIQDGWVKVHIQPEIHHGKGTIRRDAGESGWELKSRKEIDQVAAGGFSVHLNLNEMLVLSADDRAGERAGSFFFRREEDGRLMQRVVVFRVADLTRFELASL